MANSRSGSPPGCLVLYNGALSYFEAVCKGGVAGVTKGFHGFAEGK